LNRRIIKGEKVVSLNFDEIIIAVSEKALGETGGSFIKTVALIYTHALDGIRFYSVRFKCSGDLMWGLFPPLCPDKIGRHEHKCL
jgi:hypothetical protein